MSIATLPASYHSISIVKYLLLFSRQKRNVLVIAHATRKQPTSHSPLASMISQRRQYCSSILLRQKYCFESLIESLPNIVFSTNSYELERHGRGESYHPAHSPDIIALPNTIEDVRTIVRYCVKHRIPIIPFGAGTSVEGHVAALQGGLCLDMNNFQDIQTPEDILRQRNIVTFQTGIDNITLPDPIAIAGAGVTRLRLNESLRSTGYQFTVDPGANATLGGMMSTCASGTTSVKYGTMRDNILGATVVIPDDEATIVNVGTHALKNSAGYDLLSLLCGSEGTLGIITDVTVKLHPRLEHLAAAVCAFQTLQDAAQAVTMIKMRDIPILRCELLDSNSVDAFNTYNRLKGENTNMTTMDVRPTLFLEFESSSELVLNEQILQTQSICLDEFDGVSFQIAIGEADRKALWSARHQLYYASIAYRPGATSAIVTDACVPLSQFARILTETANDVEEAGVVGPCFGHAGDGNLHCILPTRDDDTLEHRNLLNGIANRLTERTLAAGGTCTGEHGIGFGKIKYLTQQYGPGAVHLMKLVKGGIDPYNIMNPGKVVNV